MIRQGLKRLLAAFLIAMAAVWLVSEAAFQLQKGQNDRAPELVELVIPPGTAELIAAGEKIPEIPQEMVFVVGDTLLVRNEDKVAHQMGPLWVPPGATAGLLLQKAERTAYTCSFQNTQYIGLLVQPSTTASTRVAALALAGPATAMFLFVYSLAIWPLGPRTRDSKDRTNDLAKAHIE